MIVALSLAVILSPIFAKITRIPIVVIEILLGSLGGYLGFFGHSDMFALIAKVGFLYLMFLAGMEINLREFTKMRSGLIQRASAYFLTLYTLSLCAYWYFNLSPIYIVTLPIFSLGMIMALIKEYGKNEPWLNLALIIGIVGELISIVALTILSGALSFGFGFEFYKAMGTLTLIVICGILFFKGMKTLFWWFPELKNMIMPPQNAKDQDVRFSMALFFILVAVMLYLKIDMVLGAFMAGMFITMFFGHKRELADKLSSFGFGFLAPIFFIFVGSTLNLDAILRTDIITHALFIMAGLVSFRFIGSFLAFHSYLGTRNTVLFALSDSMPLMFIVAVATLGYNAHAISQHEYYAFIVASMLDALTVMIVIKLFYTFTSRHKI